MLTCHMGWSYCYKETIKQDKRVVHGLGGWESIWGSFPKRWYLEVTHFHCHFVTDELSTSMFR